MFPRCLTGTGLSELMPALVFEVCVGDLVIYITFNSRKPELVCSVDLSGKERVAQNCSSARKVVFLHLKSCVLLFG